MGALRAFRGSDVRKLSEYVLALLDGLESE
jgi:hypothetical protein